MAIICEPINVFVHLISHHDNSDTSDDTIHRSEVFSRENIHFSKKNHFYGKNMIFSTTIKGKKLKFDDFWADTICM
jgi:hypothetical protein